VIRLEVAGKKSHPGRLMKPEYLEQLAKWFHEQREVFEAKGAKGDILEESAFLELVLDAVMLSTLPKFVPIRNFGLRF
jgi:hypothetical protein